MWVLQSAPCAKCGFGRYSSFTKSPSVREGERLGPSAALFALASLGTWQCPLSPKAFGRAVSQATTLRGRQEKARNKITMQRAAQKMGGQSLVKPPDFYSLLFLFMTQEGQAGRCSQLWASHLAGVPGAALAGLPGLDMAFRRWWSPKHRQRCWEIQRGNLREITRLGLETWKTCGAPKTAVKPSLPSHIFEPLPGENFWG